MKNILWITVVSCLAYCVDKELYKAIDYLKEQVLVLLEQQAKDKKLTLNNNQRRRLARKARLLSHEMLKEMTLIFTPATILGWYHRLIADKYTPKNRTPGRPEIGQEIKRLVLKIRSENPAWGSQKNH